MFQDTWTVHHYVFTDATGAEYRLDQNNGGVWSSKESIYVYYDSNAGRIYFRDGSFWVLGCTSSGLEQDAGTMYPTMVEDTNGNQITINYNAGVGVTWTNSSARPSTLRDVRPSATPIYTFTFNTDPIPHLTSITNSIGTSENYTFNFGAGPPFPLKDPFTQAAFGTVTLLQGMTQTGTNLSTGFLYDIQGTDSHTSGELTQMNTPYGGRIRWAYAPATYVGTRVLREVQNRYLIKAAGAAEKTYAILHDNPGSLSSHYWTILNDPDGLGQKFWYFQTDTSQSNIGLVTTYGANVAQGVGPGSHVEGYTWTTDSVGNSYISATTTTEDWGNSTSVQKKVTQTLDQYGNLTQMQIFDYGSYGGPPQTTAARTYTNTYLSNANYTSRYIFNRLIQSTVTDSAGRTATLASLYDGGVSDQPNMPMHDAAYSTNLVYRGNPYSVQRPGSTTSISYDIGGNVTYSTTNGVQTTATSTAANAYAVPSQLTTTSLTTNLSWSSFLGLSAETGPNGDSASISYDSNARPGTSYSPYGAQTTYAYNEPAPWAETNS